MSAPTTGWLTSQLMTLPLPLLLSRHRHTTEDHGRRKTYGPVTKAWMLSTRNEGLV